MPEEKTVIINGVFDDEDLKRLFQTVRDIEQKRPDEIYFITTVDPNMSLEEARKKVRETFPRLGDEEPICGEITKHNPEAN